MTGLTGCTVVAGGMLPGGHGGRCVRAHVCACVRAYARLCLCLQLPCQQPQEDPLVALGDGVALHIKVCTACHTTCCQTCGTPTRRKTTRWPLVMECVDTHGDIIDMPVTASPE